MFFWQMAAQGADRMIDDYGKDGVGGHLTKIHCVR